MQDETELEQDGGTTTWDELVRTAAAVRASVPAVESSPRSRRRLLLPVVAGGLMAMVASAVTLPSTSVNATNSASGDSTLFTLTNQDRASNGVQSLRSNGTLHGIGEATPYAVCGVTVAGRAQDMVNRNYFAHPIPPCNAYVFVIMNEAGVHYLSAGENIGWTGNIMDADAAATYVNGQFMQSPDHRANILNRNYTDLGIGSAYPWPGSNNAWMFSEEFAQIGATPPPPTPRPQPQPQPTSSHNATAQPGPTPLPPISTTAPTPAATPTAPPTPTATATPQPNPFTVPGEPAPFIWDQGGLLSDSVESVLESYLIN